MRFALARCHAPALVAALLPALLATSHSQTLPRESWSGMYMNGKKIGYSSLRMEAATYDDKPAIRMTSRSITRIELFGNKVSQDVSFLLFTDKSYAPLHQEYNIESNGSAMKLTADYLPGKIHCVLQSGGGSTPRDVPVPPGARLTGDDTMMNAGKPVSPGHKETFYYLNPLTLGLDKIDVEVLAKDSVTLEGRTYAALRTRATMSLGVLTSWETLDGDVLKGELPLGMTMFMEAKDRAQDMASAAPDFAIAGSTAGSVDKSYRPSDVAMATAVPVDKPIAGPRKLKALTIRVSGISDNKRLISDSRQKVAAVPGKPGAHDFRVSAVHFDPAESARLPVTGSGPKHYLARAAFLETDDPQIESIAKKLRGTHRNAYKTAVAIHDWVHETMKPDYTIGVPRSCVTLYKDPRGVCRDYATLFAGVARAAGIPTRVVGGIVYAEGKFFYHAWAECWVGQWVPFDPTMPGQFVDATHIKFSQGDVTDMYDVANVVGRIKVSVLHAE